MARKSASFLLGSMLLLLVLGLIMQVSIGPYVLRGAENPYGEAYKQGLNIGVGLIALVMALHFDYERYADWCWFLFAIALLSLLACYLPGISAPKNGARRWLDLKGASVQPSEFAKIVGIMVVAAWCAENAEARRTFLKGFFLPVCIVGALILAIAFEVDLGNASLLTVGALAVLFAAGARLRYLGMIVVTAVGGLAFAITFLKERMDRLIAFTDLEKYRGGDGLQQWQGLIAYGTGGPTGLGLGNSHQKMGSLPYANSDMISSIIGEELGGWFTIMMIGCYVTLTVAGFFIAIHAPTRFGKLLGFGLVSLIAMQTVIHLGVTTALLPNKGMPLPFVSAGGSNMICLMLAVGILLNICKQSMHLAHQDPVLGRAKLTPAL